MKVADRVKQITTTTGAGAYSLDGAAADGHRTFAAAFTTGDLVYYCCEDGTDWEVGQGVLTSGSPWTLARTLVLASSTGSAISWGGGDKNIFCTAAAHLVGFDTPFRLNKNTVSVSCTIPTGYTAVSGGPITIENGVTVTLDGDWVVV